MNIAVHVPYATYQKEAGVTFLVANYLKNFANQIAHVTCNGVSEACGRDEAISWSRSINSCLFCHREQRMLADWAGIDSVPLSQFFLPDDEASVERWSRNTERMQDAQFDGVSMEKLCGPTSKRRAILGEAKEDFERKLARGAARMLRMSRGFIKSFSPTLVLLADGTDVISASFREEVQQAGVPVLQFQWNQELKRVVVQSSEATESHLVDINFINVSNMRPDNSTWSSELIGVLDDVLTYAGFGETQMLLPMSV